MTKEKIRKILIALPTWTFTTIVFVAILYLTLMPDPLPDNDIELFPHADKVVHAIMFGGMYFVAYFDRYRQKLKRTSEGNVSVYYVIAVALSVVAFGGVIELAQSAMGAGRSADWLDFAADTAGVILSMVISPWVTQQLLGKAATRK